MTKRGDIIRAHLEEFQSIPAHAFHQDEFEISKSNNTNIKKT
jgi:hypothetical protein